MNVNYAKAKNFFQENVVTRDDGHDFLPLRDLKSYKALEDTAGYDAEIDFSEVLDVLEANLPDVAGWSDLNDLERGVVFQMAVRYCTDVDGLYIKDWGGPGSTDNRPLSFQQFGDGEYDGQR